MDDRVYRASLGTPPGKRTLMGMDRTDRELWDDAAQGSDAAFAELFDRHHRAVYNYCFRRTANWALAEDLMSATFLEAWRRRDEVRLSADSLRPWLLGVATNLLRNDIRSRRRRARAVARISGSSSLDDAVADDVAARVDDQRRMAELLDAIGELPAEQQEVVALVAWAELSYQEAALALGVPVGTVKSRMSRARRALMEPGDASGHDTDDSTALARASSKPREVEG